MRFLTYSHDSCGLGHLRRTFVISRCLSHEVPNSTVLSIIGSPLGQNYFEPESRNHDFIKLPAVKKLGAGLYSPRHLPIPLGDLIHLRRTIIEQSLLSFRPDWVIVDKNPCGLENELRAPLERLRKLRPGCRIILGLRDILDEPQTIRREWQSIALTRWINEIYDQIWIWGLPEVYDHVEQYRFPSLLRKKTCYLGYLPPDARRGDPQTLRLKAGIATDHERLLLASAGGGGDALPIFLQVIEGLRQAGDSGVRTVLVTGPLMSERDYQQIRSASRPIRDRIRVVRFLMHFDDWLRAADAVISMGGYNTLSEVAALAKPALVLPRTHPRREQSIRAEIFARHGWCSYADPEKGAAEAVRDFARELARDQLQPSVSALPCDGLNEMLHQIRMHEQTEACLGDQRIEVGL